MGLTSSMKRLVVLPTVFGYVFSIVIEKVVNASPDLKVFPMIEYFGNMYGLSNFISSSLLALVYFYFLGYGYGLLSSAFGVLKSTKKGVFTRLFFILLKTAILLPNSLFLPLIFLGDMILLLVKKAAVKKRRPITTPYQNEEKAF
ncbi:hypothetical protein QK289_15665 [Exiguobacterium antarcticum]|uniref:Uncharacterized protein n=1 Tax=Exiguobacterium antarcticum TaxID=132920 RepID=A0ABT6R660_9BACL|nr:hypothetical protein [Exiguobacterium antarcticum]MDI3236453.1 hypothetical protein [Exiguobacterium antarcticum]